MTDRRTFLKHIGALAFTLPNVLSTPYSIQMTPHQEYDLVIFGGTPAGIAMAITAARKGLSVNLINHNNHLGGMLTSGLGVWDTLYEGKRSPIYDELRGKIFAFYKEKYGENSTQYKEALPGKTGHTNGKFEPKVVERLITQMLEKEQHIVIEKGYVPFSAEVKSNSIQSITFTGKKHTHSLKVKAKIYADCSYEGDLMKVAEVPYAVGREPKEEFEEPHAGKIFMRNLGHNDHQKNVDIRHFGTSQAIVFPESTGEGDELVQAYNLRIMLSSDPSNQKKPQPSSEYDPEYLATLKYNSTVDPIPNNKLGWNRPQIIGPHNDYVEGSWEERDRVIELHRRTAMDLLYFLQNDPSQDEEIRNFWSQYGVALDEFPDNENFPYEIYVREARRLKGEYVITQHDLMPTNINMKRPPIHSDSIAVSDWYMDCHACDTIQTRDSLREGKMMLHYETYPGHIPFRSIMAENIDNLLVPVCLSSTHVAWGALRLEPTWMNIAESAGVAAVLSVQHNNSLADLPKEELLVEIADNNIMTTFYNDFDISSNKEWIPAVQYFGNKGFFPDYDLRINQPLDKGTAQVWCSALPDILNNDHNAQKTAFRLINNESGEDIDHSQLSSLLSTTVKESVGSLDLSQEGVLTRGEAITWLYIWFKKKLKA